MHFTRRWLLPDILSEFGGISKRLAAGADKKEAVSAKA